MSKKEKKEKELIDPAQNEEVKETKAAEETAEAEVVPETDLKDAEIADLKDKLLRNMAEFDNYRKRTAKERLDIAADITAKNLTEFLPVIDNLERALGTECTDPNYKKGIELIHESFVTALTNMGVEAIVSDGEPFDPAYHQAVQQVEDDSKESGTVATTFMKGYKIGEKVLRFAMVTVVK